MITLDSESSQISEHRLQETGSHSSPTASDGYDVSGLERILAPTPPAKTVRRPARDRIVRYLAAGVLHINVVVNMRVHPFHFRDHTGELDRPILVVFCRERVVRKRRRGEGCEKSESRSYFH